ncbi:ABC transporter ATP-binding protein [Phycisphaera mikurensis]|uniref:Putative ABC transporter ATP-binding protein n=1 Tax=Phycisphaera mikurensis (strain NBRC 102666 / KCTC 22515 / FYK2301M01) TaxID=1142394 RepID=I0IGY2_PHYMF|nr:ABC transporter ATP-binding protein [Phycisphaera mikurensis]MBB6440777.1 ABC-type dipeptide/oligopeptide/nickel transport system ATPase component [Phycisphaera mikurensis]BAM04520.1 putative ABC transporter ATP-binding protein [Phycisphaera mikurensis NBRC 102666]
MQDAPPLLEVRDLTVRFGDVVAADGVSMEVHAGETLAVVGESGSGKSVTAMSVLGLIPEPPGETTSGEIWWRGGADGDAIDLLAQPEKRMRRVRGAQIAMIFQEPMTSLNPVYTIGDQITEAVLLHRDVSPGEAEGVARDALQAVGVADPAARLHEYPHQASGGMRQRYMIAMALACRPRLLLADEPTTALDVTIQAQILGLLRTLQAERGMAVMLITHDLGVVAENADRVVVMQGGRVLEVAGVDELFADPRHPYTRGLLAAMPRLGHTPERLPTVPAGAALDRREGACLQEVEAGHFVRS